MQTKVIHEGNHSFQTTVGTDRGAMATAIDVGAATLKRDFYKSMRNPVNAHFYCGTRPWPEVLTAENVASWIAANVSYACPSDAHTILKAMVFENNVAAAA